MPAILGVDHICGSSPGVKSSMDFGEKLGFETKFVETSLSVHAAKRTLLRRESQFHDAVFLFSGNTTSIELISYKNSFNETTSPNDSVYLCDQTVSSPNVKELPLRLMGKCIAECLSCDLVHTYLPDIEISFYQSISKIGFAPGVHLIAMYCEDLNRSTLFWQEGLGFKKIDVSNSNSKWQLLEFSALSRSWSVKLLLIEQKEKMNSLVHLDDIGWPCLSIIVTNIDVVLQHLKRFGIGEDARPYATKVGGKSIDLCFMRGPDSELIELIQLKGMWG